MFPSCFIFFQILKSGDFSLALELEEKGSPGEIIKDHFTIACGTNSIQILEIQKEGKNKMKTLEFLKGNSLKIGDKIK